MEIHAFYMGMYVRTIKRKNKDGSEVEYIQLAHNTATLKKVILRPRSSTRSGDGTNLMSPLLSAYSAIFFTNYQHCPEQLLLTNPREPAPA